MTLEQALLIAISSLTVVVLALWRKSVTDEKQCRIDIRELQQQISSIWKELHTESVKIMQDMVKVTVENTNILNALHKRIDRLDILRVIDEDSGAHQSQIIREK